MHPHVFITAILAIGFVTGSSLPAGAQERLSVAQAVVMAMAGNPDTRVVAAAAEAARQRVPQARSGLLPRIELTESWQRGNQPVFVFGSLLAQRQFSEANFAVDALNHPDPVSNLRTALTVEQLVFDGGRAGAAVSAANLEHEMALASVRQSENDLVLAVTRAYGQVLVAAAARAASAAAVIAADEDARTATARREAGIGTEADALSLQVHLAKMRERAIRADADERIARAELNRVMGVPLERVFVLEESGVGLDLAGPLETLAEQALASRPEARRAALGEELTVALKRSANAAFLPQLVAQGAYEWNGSALTNGKPAWAVGLHARLSLSAGSAELARRREIAASVVRAGAERVGVEAAIRLEVLSATERLKASSARRSIGTAMVTQAQESQRMIRDRYEAGLASVGDVLRAADAVLAAESQRIDALVDAMVDRAALARAIGEARNKP